MRPFRFAVVLLFFVALAPALFAKQPPPMPTQWLTDEAGLLSASDATALNEKLHAFEQSSGAQFIIYIFKSLDGDPLEDFTIRCAQNWKVGNKKYDNGLILFVFVQEKKFRIEVGYGLEGAVTDAYSSRVERDYLVPHFRQGDFAGGLNAGADALMAKIRGEEPAHAPVNPDSSRSVSDRSSNRIPPIAILFLIIFFLFIVPRFFLPRRGSGCGGCFWPMFFLGGGGRGSTFGGGGFGGGGFGGFGGGGGFSGGGGGFGGGGASGGW